MTEIMHISREYTLQDGKMNSISISASTADAQVLISQTNSSIHIPRKYITDIVMILEHIRDEVI